MITDKLYSKTYFKVLSILHIALVVGLVLFGSIITLLLLVVKTKFADAGLSKAFDYIGPAVTIAGLLSSKLVFKKKVAQIPSDATLDKKMTDYRAALILRYALLEGPAIFAIIAAFITANFTLLIFAGILVVSMLQARPTPQKAISDLALDDRERMVIEDPDGIIE